ncbi:MAG: FAD-dependent oxidoreductase, partial [Acidimicrobiales bacterium]
VRDAARPPVARAVDLLVVGAGPAGLEAARVASLAGHSVRVVERADRSGGMLRTAAEGAGRRRLAVLCDWLESECVRLGARLELGAAARACDVEEHLLAGGRVVLASGSVPGELRYRAEPGARVLVVEDVMRMLAQGGLEGLAGRPVVVDDPSGGPVGVHTAELLASAGAIVSLVTGDAVAAVMLASTGDLGPANRRLAAAGVRVRARQVLRVVGARRVVIQDRWSRLEETLEAAAVVDAGYRLPAPALVSDRPGVTRVGDAVAPRTVYEAVLEGRRAALALGQA